MRCPSCNYKKSTVEKTIDKHTFVIRFRKCLNKKCGYHFKTKEMISAEWNYRNIVKEIKDVLRDVKT